MSESLTPSTPVAPLAQHEEDKGRVTLDLKRQAVVLKGLQTQTCIECGARKATKPATYLLRRLTDRVDLHVAICDTCAERLLEDRRFRAKIDRRVQLVYIAQLVAFGVGMGTGAHGIVFTIAPLAFLGTWFAGYLSKKRRSREPRLLQTGKTIRLDAPSSWLRVLTDERGDALQ